MELPLTVAIGPSRRLTALVAAAHAIAAATAMLVPSPWWLMWPLLGLIAVSAWRHLRYGQKRVAGLRLYGDGRLELLRQDGSRGVASVHPHTTVTASLTVLLLRRSKGSEALVLLPDAIAREDFRKLRLWLRWRPAAG